MSWRSVPEGTGLRLAIIGGLLGAIVGDHFHEQVFGFLLGFFGPLLLFMSWLLHNFAAEIEQSEKDAVEKEQHAAEPDGPRAPFEQR